MSQGRQREPVHTINEAPIAYYAIRHRPTGNFLPERPNVYRYGHTLTEPQPINNVFPEHPRLFHTRRCARQALAAWLKGRWDAKYYYGEFEGCIIVSVSSRKPEDMEIVRLELRVVEEHA